MRICVVYDCLYPHTIGGAERWYRALTERLAAAGHEVTYLTLRQWGEDERPDAPDGVQVVAVGRRMDLYAHGRRRRMPPLRFGAGVLRHLLEHGAGYDVVHTASFPYFSLLAAGGTRQLRGPEIVVDWFEVWSHGYWKRYAGPVTGEIGWRVQRMCARLPHDAFCFSRLHARRLVANGYRGEPSILRGLYAGPPEPAEPSPAGPVVVYAGRHIPEKRVRSLVPALLRARKHAPELRLEIYGDGPERPLLLQAIAAAGLESSVRAPGFVDEETLEAAMRRALCVVLPSEREGYGLVVVEAAARGVPSIVVRGPDNAAAELVEPGINGLVADSARAEDLAAAILAVKDDGQRLRRTTSEWFARNVRELRVERSLEAVLETYSRLTSEGRLAPRKSGRETQQHWRGPDRR